MTRLGSTKVSSGEHSRWRIQGDDVIKGLILARAMGAGLGAGHPAVQVASERLSAV